MQELDQRDRELLTLLQAELPIASTPYAFIGQSIDMSEKEVLKRIARLKTDGTIKLITAVFDGRALGYQSCLVAAQIPEEEIEQSAAVISAHPGVTQNYRRNHDFNVWFTIGISPRSRLGLQRTVELLGEEASCKAIRLLPTLRQLKTTEGETNGDGAEPSEMKGAGLTDEEVEWVRMLQRDLPLQPRPFEALARSLEADGDALLSAAKTFRQRQQLRRIAAIVQPRKQAFSATAMGVWAVAPEKVDEFAAAMAANRAVSHCYLRPTYDDWPYNVFTTVHGRSVDECESMLKTISYETGIDEMKALFPTREFKKSRITYFGADQEAWEAQRLSADAASAAS